MLEPGTYADHITKYSLPWPIWTKLTGKTSHFEDIEAWTKWPTKIEFWVKFRLRLFQLTIHRSVLVQVFAWCQTGNKPWQTEICDAIWIRTKFGQKTYMEPGINLCMRSANGRLHYIVMWSVIGLAHTQKDPCGNAAHKLLHMKIFPVVSYHRAHAFDNAMALCVFS